MPGEAHLPSMNLRDAGLLSAGVRDRSRVHDGSHRSLYQAFSPSERSRSVRLGQVLGWRAVAFACIVLPVRVPAYHLPAIEAELDIEWRCAEGVEVGVARLRPQQLRTAIEHARAASRALRTRAVDEVLETLDRVISLWLRPDGDLRRRAEAVLPATTGFSPAMIRHALPLLIAPLRAENVHELLHAELGDHGVLDGVHRGRRACSPNLITHVLSGNIPGLSATPAVLTLAVKSAALMKAATGDVVFPAVFASSIAALDPDLGECLVVTHWPGGDHGLEEIAFAAADVVVASGSDAALAAIQRRVRGRFIGYGHKVSFAAVGKEAVANADAARALARRLAYDVSVWDQQGCLSPQLCYLERGGGITPEEFAQLLSEALSGYATELPPRRLGFEERAAVQRFRQEAEWHGDKLITSSESTDWTVTIERDARFLPTCLNRCMRVQVVDSIAGLAEVLRPHRTQLEAAGLACGADRFASFAEMLITSGVCRICHIGTMQRPPLSWRQGGRPRVADWGEWAEVEEEPAHSDQ